MIKKLLYFIFAYTISFLMISYIKFKDIFIVTELVMFYAVLMASSLFSSILLGKFSIRGSNEFVEQSKNTVKAFLVNLGTLTLIVSFFDGFTTSRLLIVGSLTLGLIFEFLYLVFNSELSHKVRDKNIFSFSFIFVIIEFIILTWITFYSLLNYEFPGYNIKEKILFIVVIYTVWFSSSAIRRHTDVSKGVAFGRIIWNHLNSYIVLFFMVSILVFLLGLPLEIKKITIINIALFSLWSLISVVVFYIYSSVPKTDNVAFGLFNSTEFPEDFYSDENENLSEDVGQKYSDKKYGLLNIQLENIYLKKMLSVYEFINKNLFLRSFDISECVLLRSADTYNVEVLPEDSVALYMNLHEMNDIRRINAYLININLRLKTDGYFIGRFQSNTLRLKFYHKKYPFYLANIIYSFDLFWKRIFPKLPILKKVFFFLSRGKNRALSMAEGLGRLYYCGFNVKAIQEIDNQLYFIAQKKRKPSTDKNPSYGLTFKMRRVGQYGEPIYVYKLRTMHPYSEYLQKFIHDNFNLKSGGKFENDFRITSWGKVARKLWIDELPMFVNLFRRELKLVGIRPLSFHYMSLYDSNYVVFRNKFKPGLIPPFYADMPKTLEEIQKSEQKYLQEYEEKKIMADITYFLKIFYNIFFKNARSS